MLELSFYNDQKLFLRVQLGSATITLGSGDDCEVQLPHRSVEGHHARITSNPNGEYWIKDLSRSGTRLNDSWLSGRTRLQPGSRIYIANYVLVFQPASIHPGALPADPQREHLEL